jgi:hypothetical protein
LKERDEGEEQEHGVWEHGFVLLGFSKILMIFSRSIVPINGRELFNDFICHTCWEHGRGKGVLDKPRCLNVVPELRIGQRNPVHSSYISAFFDLSTSSMSRLFELPFQ